LSRINGARNLPVVFWVHCCQGNMNINFGTAIEIILDVANHIFPEAWQRNITVLYQEFTHKWRCNVQVLVVQSASSFTCFCCVMFLETSLTGWIESAAAALAVEMKLWSQASQMAY
jgi:hypothetical protein